MGPCPLCKRIQNRVLVENYTLCENCSYVFIDRDSLPSREEERRIYDYHQNDPNDPEYIIFLSQITGPLEAELAMNFRDNSAHLEGLDFGCGPGPTICTMLEEKKYSVSNYDPIYANDISLLDRKWDFIVSTEVFEHLHNPKESIERLLNSLKPGAVIAIMTLMINDDMLKDTNLFQKWFYKNDPTHVGFFHKQSFEYLAKTYSLGLKIWNDRCITLRKSMDSL